MTATTNGHAPMAASPAVVRSLLDRLAAKKYTGGALGVRAAADWPGPETFTHRGATVRVAGCPSTLAVWEALHNQDDVDWLVILTPRDHDELGGGVLSQLLGNNLRTPDPWQAVQQRFGADALDARLYAHGSQRRELASGLLAVLAEGDCTPAPGGVLTRDHAMQCVARSQLHITDDRELEIDVTTVLRWSLGNNITRRLADLRSHGGGALADEVIDWLAGRCGAAAGPIRTLLTSGRVAMLVPLGLVAGLVSTTDRVVSHAAGRFQGKYELGTLTPDTLAAWHADAAGIVTHDLATGDGTETARHALHTAEARANELGMDAYARDSELLPAGLWARLGTLAREIRAVLPETAASSDVDTQLVSGDTTAAEEAFDTLRQHYLAAGDDTVRAYQAAMRLLRWLATDTALPHSSRDWLDTVLTRHMSQDSWVDSAVTEAARGTADTDLADTLHHIITLARQRRTHHDRAFAATLGNSQASRVAGVEQVLPNTVLPLARQRPVLLLVLDGLSAAVANDLVTDASQAGWAEHALPGNSRRAGALAVLPSLTETSRTSLLCGELRQGDDTTERQGFTELLQQAALTAQLSGDTAPPLFHKRQLESAKPGQTLSETVDNAIADTDGLRLVGAVLNAIDDALHHTDPGGIDWRLDTVRHLKPLLEAARRAGRSVVITSDHGHVIERRDGTARSYPTTHGARARPTTAEHPAGDDEITVRGQRVLTGDGSAVLAVDEHLRYGQLAAGYHGGGSPAEVATPVILLHPAHLAADSGHTSIDGVTPAWWNKPVASSGTTSATRHPDTASEQPQAPVADQAAPTLFDVDQPPSDSQPSQPSEAAATLAKNVVRSTTFKQQRSIAGRVPVGDKNITALLTSLLAAPDRRIPEQQAAADLGVAVSRLRRALAAVKRLLDIEGYVVVAYEPTSGDVVLDEPTLREQFALTD